MKHLISLFSLSILLLCSACDDDDSPASPGGNVTNNSTFSCEIDGVAFDTQYPFVTGTSSSNSGFFNRSAAGVRIANGDTTSVTITLTTLSEDAFQVGATFDAANTVLGEFCIGTVFVNSSGVNMYEGSSTENEGPATCTITEINTGAETFSGTFSFEAYDEDLDETRVVTSGVFTNVPYD